MSVVRAAVVLGFAVALLLSAQAGSARTQAGAMKIVGVPVWTLAMDGPRVAYTSGRTGSSESIHVWNVSTGSTSVVGGSVHAFAVHHATQLAITGRRVTWLRSQQYGNTELEHWLYTARIGGPAHRLRHAFGGADVVCGPSGPQIGGLVGGSGTVAVSLWNGGADGSSQLHQRLALVGPTGVQTIATGANAILSSSVDSGHIAVLPFPTLTVSQEGSCNKPTSPTSVFVYSTSGRVLQTTTLPAPDQSALGYQVAIQGTKLIVLAYGLHQPSGPSWVSLMVYKWTTGALLHTWPVAIPQYPGEVNFSFYGNLAAVEGPFRLHLVNLNTGKDVTIARASGTNSPTAFGSRGLVYALNPHDSGRLVFVPTAKLRALAR